MGIPRRRKWKADSSIVCHLNEFNLKLSFDFLGPSLVEAYPPCNPLFRPLWKPPALLAFVIAFCSAFVWSLSQACVNFSPHIVRRLWKLLLNLHKHICIPVCAVYMYVVCVPVLTDLQTKFMFSSSE